MNLKEKLFGTSDTGLLQYDKRYIDKTFWILFIILIVAALVALFSATSTLVYKSGSILGPVGHQLIFILLGIGLAWIVQFLPSWLIRLCGYIGLGLSVLMLWSMLIPHNPFVVSVNGASRWFKLGIAFQPSEFAKIGLVIVVADQLARAKNDEQMKKAFYRTLGITAATVFPIMVGNLSTAVLMAGIVVLLWILASVPWKYIVTTVGIALGILLAGYFIVEFGFVRTGRELPGLFQRAKTWVGRIDDMILEKASENAGETFVLNDDNYQRSLAKVAVARGGLSPVGVLPGNSKERDYLPLAFADYIFAIIVEETGFVGALFLIFLYLAILFRACYASSRFGEHTAMLMVMGLALMITCQAFISMAVAVGIDPVTGQPLPMITLGGTSTLATALYFGIMMAVSREQNQIKGQQEDAKEVSLNDIPDLDVNP